MQHGTDGFGEGPPRLGRLTPASVLHGKARLARADRSERFPLAYYIHALCALPHRFYVHSTSQITSLVSGPQIGP